MIVLINYINTYKLDTVHSNCYLELISTVGFSGEVNFSRTNTFSTSLTYGGSYSFYNLELPFEEQPNHESC